MRNYASLHGSRWSARDLNRAMVTALLDGGEHPKRCFTSHLLQYAGCFYHTGVTDFVLRAFDAIHLQVHEHNEGLWCMRISEHFSFIDFSAYLECSAFKAAALFLSAPASTRSHFIAQETFFAHAKAVISKTELNTVKGLNYLRRVRHCNNIYHIFLSLLLKDSSFNHYELNFWNKRTQLCSYW